MWMRALAGFFALLLFAGIAFADDHGTVTLSRAGATHTPGERATFTVDSDSGMLPAEIEVLLDKVDAVTVNDVLLPFGTCDNATDCQSRVNRLCASYGSSGNTPVQISYNTGTGEGSCSGSCANGWQVQIVCGR